MGALTSAALLLALTACGGGGSHATAPIFPGAASSGTNTGTTNTAATTTARFALTIPNRAKTTATRTRRAQYVSPSTLSASITVNPGGHTTTIDLPAVGGPCTAVSGGRACNLSVVAPFGADTASLTLYDGACTGGPPCTPTGEALGAASAFAFTVTEGTTNVTVPLIVGGIPAYADVSATGLTAGTPATVPLVVTVYDDEQHVIVGPASYVDATGVAAPVSVARTTSTTQVTLYNGAQSGGFITVASPSDTPTIQLNAPATILGATLTARSAAAVKLAPLHQTNAIAVSGTLTSTQVASVGFSPDYVYLAPSNPGWVSGVPAGFAFSIEATGSGVVGYFNALTEAISQCGFSGYNIGVAPITSGLAVAYNGADNINTTPTGVQYIPSSSLTGGGCSGGTTYRTDTSGGTFAKSMAFDQTTSQLFEGDDNGSSGGFRYDTFLSPNLSGNTGIGSTLLAVPHDMLSLGDGVKYFLVASGPSIYAAAGTSVPGITTVGSATLTALAASVSGGIYALDTTGKQVWKFGAVANPLAAYTPANGFTIALSTQTHNLAIGPDGSAYATDGASTIQSVTPAGGALSYAIPAPGGNIGYMRGIFDGQNGFVYAYYDDGLNAAAEYVFRISH